MDWGSFWERSIEKSTIYSLYLEGYYEVTAA
jgi:hypothetical protein